MANSPNLLFGQPLRKACTPWFERIGKPDSDQLRKLFDLAIAERTPLYQILADLFPEKDEPKGLVALNSLRKRLNDASSGKDHDLPDLRLRLQTDSKKKHPTTERSCWFTGPDPTIEAASEMSRLDRKIGVDKGWHEEIQRAIADCDFGLLMVCPAFLGSKYITEKELPHFVTSDNLNRTSRSLTAGERQGVSPPCSRGVTRRADAQPLARLVGPTAALGVNPVMAVGLAKLDFKHQDLKGLEERQIYRLRKPGDPNGKFFSDLRASAAADAKEEKPGCFKKPGF